MKKALIISCFDWYELRLKYVQQGLIETGYKVEILLCDFDHMEKKYITRQHENTRYVHTWSYSKNMSFRRIISHSVFARKSRQEIEKLKPDLVYALIPPNLLAWQCSKYKKKNDGMKLYFDIIDMWPESIPNEKIRKLFVYDLWKKIRDKSLKYADFIFTECDFYREKLTYVIDGERGMTQYLCMPQITKMTDTIPLTNTLNLCYLGSINSLIDIDLLVNIADNLRSNQGFAVVVHIIGDGEKRMELLQKLEEHKIETVYYGKIYDIDKKNKIFAKCHFGLNLMKQTVCVGLTTKSLEYLSAGLPMINSIKGDTWKFVETRQLGLNTNMILEHSTRITEENIRVMKENVIKTYGEVFLPELFLKKLEDVIASDTQRGS